MKPGLVIFKRILPVALCGGFACTGAIAQTDALFVAPSGDVGVGTVSPTTLLHVSNPTDAVLLVENTSTTAAERKPLQITNNGKTRFVIDGGSSRWTFDNDGDFFNISLIGTGQNEFRVDGSGNGIFRANSFAVQHVNTSSRSVKSDIAPIDAENVLNQLAELPIANWRYNSEEPGARHVGPMAEDFQKTFGLGDGKHISTVDANGVAFAAIQALHSMVETKSRELNLLREQNDTLSRNNAELAQRLSNLEELLLEGGRLTHRD